MSWAAAGAAIGQAAGDIIGGWSAGEQSRRTSERMYTHRYQWQMKDLRKAGLNPMLSISNAPPVPAQPIVPDMSQIGSRTGSAYRAARLNDAEVHVARAQEQGVIASARKTNAEAQILENSPEHSAGNWMRRQTMFEDLQRKLRVEVESLEQDLKGKKLQYATDEELKPLIVSYQRWMAEAARLGIPEAAANARYWEAAGVGGVVARKVLDAVPGGDLVRKVFDRGGRGTTIPRRR